MFKKVLIANRGEVATRVIRACKELGIQTVAIYSEADVNSLHVKKADEAYLIHGDPVKAYLNYYKIVDIAKRAGAEAIHPGYGFLSERADFAQYARKHGIEFIGPSVEHLRVFGNKIEAKRLMKELGVPVAEGSQEPVSDLEEAKEIAKKIGYPVMIKAAHGGGGRGMRLIEEPEGAEALIVTAMAEAEAAFGSGEIYIEKYIENPHHVEVQVVADSYGNVVTFGERECSLQRRHQKLVEESPSLFITESVRRELSQAALKIAEYINYEGAGTVEFLVDERGNFYFIEMNTRIQVEHPVTEMVFRKDLISLQILSAAGEKIDLNQTLPLGHAIEFRVNCEDYEKDFRPSPGRIEKLLLPGGFGVRVDTYVYEGYQIPVYYDSLIAKLIVWGESRKEAIKRAKRALSEFIIEGNLKTLIPFHLKLLENELFVSGNYNTKSLEKDILPQMLSVS